MSMKYEMSAEQQSHPIFFALGKLEKRMTKDMRQVPEEKLQDGMRRIANAILWACEGDAPALTVAENAE